MSLRSSIRWDSIALERWRENYKEVRTLSEIEHDLNAATELLAKLKVEREATSLSLSGADVASTTKRKREEDLDVVALDLTRITKKLKQ